MKNFAVFWDQSFLWGLFLYDTLLELQLPFDVLNAQAIRQGALKHYSVLIVPGGWAIHKKASLGTEGEKAIRKFVHSGGCYLGLCGGAGLGLSGKNTLDMVPTCRLSFKDRLPSASGTVYIKIEKSNLDWGRNLPDVVKTSVWWPSQFAFEQKDCVTPVAFYRDLGKDFWVSDIPIEGIEIEEIKKLEDIYGINLDPWRCFLNSPAIIESCYGSGRLILSYPHLETPKDEEGNEFFRQCLLYLEEQAKKFSIEKEGLRTSIPHPPSKNHCHVVKRMLVKVSEFIRLGECHLMWFWRKPWLLGWKRGVRGLEYSMLATCLAFLYASVEALTDMSESRKGNSANLWEEKLNSLENLIDEFITLARKLLVMERLASFAAPLSKTSQVGNAQVDGLREYLFGHSMNHGGLCRRIFDIIDSLLFDALLLLKNYGNSIRLQSAVTMWENLSA
ncbi:MAG: BPL-N domain-containing protein [Thermodesulforhabdaceae bacterium]